MILRSDNDLVISENSEKVLRKEIGKHFELKNESVGPLSACLRRITRKLLLENGLSAQTFSSSHLAHLVVKIMEECLAKGNKRLDGKSTPTKSSCGPELGASHDLRPKESSHYHSLTGMLRWITELGRIDVYLEASVIAL